MDSAKKRAAAVLSEFGLDVVAEEILARLRTAGARAVFFYADKIHQTDIQFFCRTMVGVGSILVAQNV